MTKEHSIKFIQIIDKGITRTKYLESTAKPEAEFQGEFSENITAREYCNLHGLWKN